MAETVFTSCPKCQNAWLTRGDFLRDPAVRLLGFQPGTIGDADGVILFSHDLCGGNLPVELPRFDGLVQAPKYAASSKTFNTIPFCTAELCNAYCPTDCACDYVWHVMGLIQSWPKNGGEVFEKSTEPSSSSS